MLPLWGFMLFLACFYNHFSPTGLVLVLFIKKKDDKKKVIQLFLGLIHKL